MATASRKATTKINQNLAHYQSGECGRIASARELRRRQIRRQRDAKSMPSFFISSA